LQVEVFCSGGGHFEIEGLQRTDPGENADEKGQETVAEAGALVGCAPFAAVFALIEAIEEALAGHGGVFFDDFVFFHGQGYACHMRDEAAD
jgi:hypothetical protein